MYEVINLKNVPSGQQSKLAFSLELSKQKFHSCLEQNRYSVASSSRPLIPASAICLAKPLGIDESRNLVEMNDFLKRSGNSFYKLIKDLNVDSQLFEFIVSNLDYFKDVSTYDGEEVLFYKRAQLLTSDILHVREKKEQIDVDYSHLIGCADYKIPQVMRCYGMLGFSDSLADRVDNKVELEEGSKEEVEIRANTLKVIDYIYETLDRKYSRMDINDFIWLLGQDKSKMTKPYHRTLTKHY